MSHHLDGDDSYYMVTDGIAIFHYIGQLTTDLACGHDQLYAIKADTEDELFAMVFVDPVRDEGSGDYHIDDLVPKNIDDIIAVSVEDEH